MEVNIRQAAAGDFEAVKKITQDTILAVYPKYYPSGAVRFFSEHHADEKIIRDINAGIVYVVVTDDGVLAGTVTLTDNEVDRLFVLPEFQGRGYGRELLLWGINHIRENNENSITLHVAEWNQGACKLYKSVGFKVINKERIK